MFPAEVRHEASAAEEGALGRSQEMMLSPTSCPTVLSMTHTHAMFPGSYASSGFGLQRRSPLSFNSPGQIFPLGIKPRVTVTLWEDEGCRCFQVDAKGISVARRDDNQMINGTKLLGVAGLTRARRDGILKNEKTRHVVKVGLMHLKGVWIPFERALELANKEKITELLYPLFVHDIGSLIQQPLTQKSGGSVDFGHTKGEKELAEQKDNHVHQIEVSEDNDQSLQSLPLNATQSHETQDQGPIETLSRSLIETLRLILADVKMQPDMAQQYGSLESSCAALFFWEADLGLLRGDLDATLQGSPQLRDTCLTVLASIAQFISISLIHLISSEPRRKEVLRLTEISTSLEQTMNMIEQQHHSFYQPEQDAEILCQTLRTKIDTFIMLAPSLASPAEESFDDEEPRAIQYIEENIPEQVYASSISHKFPLAAPEIVAQLGKLNWDRYNHMLCLQRETIQQELQASVIEKARTMFNDSGLGVSLQAKSEAGLNTAVDSVYAPSVVSARAEASHKRVPPLPAQARAGDPFTCEVCNRQVQFQRTKAWKKHVFDDILAYACFFTECNDTRMFFENSEALMTHLQDHHGMDVRISDVTCPLCAEFTTGDRDILSLHIARHMEEIALAILPSGVDSDDESADDLKSETTLSEDQDDSQTRLIECAVEFNDKRNSKSPELEYPGTVINVVDAPTHTSATSEPSAHQSSSPSPVLLPIPDTIDSHDSGHDPILPCASTHGDDTARQGSNWDPNQELGTYSFGEQSMPRPNRATLSQSHDVPLQGYVNAWKELGGMPLDEAIEVELSRYVKQEDEFRWRCKVPECTKLFKSKYFWRKHVENRHSEWLEQLEVINKRKIEEAKERG